MKILFLSRWYPSPPDNGSKLRIFHLLRELSRVHTIDLISFTAEPLDTAQTSPLNRFCRNIWTTVYSPIALSGLAGVTSLFAPRPRSVIATYSAELDLQAQTAANNEHYDLVIASQLDMAPYGSKLNVPVRLFEEAELTTIWEQYATQRNPFKRARGLLTWLKLKSYIRQLTQSYQACTVVSEEERTRLRQAAPRMKSITVIPNGVDTEFMSGDFGEPEPDTLVYNGALTYQANFDAVAYFLAEIFPRIQSGAPNARLLITGKTDGVRLERLPQNSGVEFTGYLQDVRPRVAGSWVSVVPLRIGGGTRLKILESLALGTPVVATTKGAEGLHLRAGEDYLRADSPAAFADATLRILKSAEMRAMLSEAGRKKVRDLYDWSTIGRQLNTLISKIVAEQQTASSPVAVAEKSTK
jgi:glycosyltransferase involved in cell wall biosynthesis